MFDEGWKVNSDVVAALHTALSSGSAMAQISTFRFVTDPPRYRFFFIPPLLFMYAAALSQDSLWDVGLSVETLTALVNLLVAVHCRLVSH